MGRRDTGTVGERCRGGWGLPASQGSRPEPCLCPHGFPVSAELRLERPWASWPGEMRGQPRNPGRGRVGREGRTPSSPFPRTRPRAARTPDLPAPPGEAAAVKSQVRGSRRGVAWLCPAPVLQEDAGCPPPRASPQPPHVVEVVSRLALGFGAELCLRSPTSLIEFWIKPSQRHPPRVRIDHLG